MDLIITNGDAAGELLRKAVQGAEVLPWRDVLHDGPIPETQDLAELSRLRADFLAAKGWGTKAELENAFSARDRGLAQASVFDRVVLWFEHDLYDQLQLIQILDWFGGEPRPEAQLYLVQADEFLGQQTPETIGELAKLEEPVFDQQVALAKRAWEALRQPTPEAWFGLLNEDLSPLPFLKSAVRRLLEELPSAKSGLSRTEREILKAIRSGIARPRDLFGAVQAQEEAAFMGDWSFWDRLDGLTADPSPLIDGLNTGPFRPDMGQEAWQSYLNAEVRLTVIGNEILAGNEDFARHASIDRWWGGTHLSNDALWRWDAANGSLIPPATERLN
ncbi:MAG: DUF1835 domain-containing protein [Methyloligellaceae bacterium]